MNIISSKYLMIVRLDTYSSPVIFHNIEYNWRRCVFLTAKSSGETIQIPFELLVGTAFDNFFIPGNSIGFSLSFYSFEIIPLMNMGILLWAFISFLCWFRVYFVSCFRLLPGCFAGARTSTASSHSLLWH